MNDGFGFPYHRLILTLCILCFRLLKQNLNPPTSPKDETPPVSEPDLTGENKQLKPNNAPPQPESEASKENYDMFMLQRVKALQQVNPALKALIDLQGIIS